MNHILARPLAIIDLETTGIDVRNDRIVEISILKILPDGEGNIHITRRVNPERPIQKQTSAIHGILDGCVANLPTFKKIAIEVLQLLEDCDLCGFNLKRFDLRMLCCEFARGGLTFSLEGRAIIDPLEIYHSKEPRDLNAAESDYFDWMMDKGDFLWDVKSVITNFRGGRTLLTV